MLSILIRKSRYGQNTEGFECRANKFRFVRGGGG